MIVAALARSVAETAIATRFEDIPARAVSQSKRAILDVIGVAVSAAQTDTGSVLREHLLESAAPGRSSVIGEHATRAAYAAAMVNGTLAHVLDYDDRGHSSTHLVTALLAIAEAHDVDGRQFLRAYVLGRELRASMDGVVDEGRLDGRGPGARGWHSTGVDGPVASALAAGLLLDLEAPTLARSMGAAASFTGGLIANFGTPVKPLHAGRAAAGGVEAAYLARAGLGGDPAAIDGAAGLFDALGADPQDASSRVLERYGRSWDLVERGVRIKPYPSCTTTHPGIETALRVHTRTGGLGIDGIERIRMDLRPFMLRRPEPQDATEARFSMAHGVLVALSTGRCAASDFTDAQVVAFRDAGAYRLFEHHPGAPALVVVLRDGRTVEEQLAPLRNLEDDDAIRSKFQGCTDGAWTREEQERVASMIDTLEELPSLRPLGDLLRTARISLGEATATASL